jgi:PAS domain S-box-containing protein
MKTGAFKIAVLYTLAGILWITLSDRILVAMQKHVDLDFVLFLGSVKGICYVLITGVMLYQLIKLYTKRLAESEEQYRSYFEEHPTPQWIINRRTMLFVAANNAATIYYGYSREEFLKMSALDIRPQEDTKESIMLFRELKTGINDIGIRRHLKKDGALINVKITAQVLSKGHTQNVLVNAIKISG